MPVLPIPLIFSLILLVLLSRALLRRTLGLWLGLLLAGCALQSALVALVHHYGFGALRPVMPVSAACLPPLAWLAFVVTTQRPPRRGDLWHGAGPLASAGLLALWPSALDPSLILLFLAYGGAIGLRLAKGRDSLTRLGLASGDLPWQLWGLVATVLIGAGISDIWVWVDFVRWQGAHVPLIVGVFSALNLLVLGAVALAPVVSEGEAGVAGEQPLLPTSEEAGKDIGPDALQLFATLEARMQQEELYLDPDLSLQRLARRLAVPVKRLSAAVNASTDENVSRYVNAYRVARAAELLSQGSNVTEAMFASGFNTKSNFNREFRRIKGKTPSQWRQAPRT
ncbi:DNA-binding transcriptional activator FeaR [Tritonibacter multivorans]|uniref:DNA-binding transcriptional activator FeaR n=1 Tax=Tritonibacter multivorans TaxID=928856 RepID=A0A0N7LZX5_9RHOB|nr:helix-turn-helix domain-containing protein [Tritonibacter multivorans]MDA7421386.1 helix-turn-helix domain-containing protein [Tritonibacter multivorans]CUH78881.1 DNA-binding transcriptional activator FeaR [Tritonibacter multivorans]SFD28159.1 AraC-type DNA-binding protein [Tritonibacter multivorans]